MDATAQVRAFNRRMADFARAGRPVMFSAGTYERTARWPDYGLQSVPSDGPSRCMAGRFYVHIEANGDVHPCQPHGSSLQPLNVVRCGRQRVAVGRDGGLAGTGRSTA